VAILALEDGTVWRGTGFGADTQRVGEVVFNTALSGYQEILTDPSYRGQMVVMTATQIGNTGITPEDGEGAGPQVEAFLVRELTLTESNWRSQGSLAAYLREHGVPGVTGINTRALTLHLRTYGALKGAVSTRDAADPATLIAQARAWEGIGGRDLVRGASCEAPYQWHTATASTWGLDEATGAGAAPHIAVYDFGVKHNILRRLRALGCTVTVIPATMAAAEVMAMRPDGVLLSNGPGDPEGLPYAVDAARSVMEGNVPVLGICLGHQLIGLALGAKTYKLKFGHHGANQPVREGDHGHVRITSQNHNYAVDPAGLPANAEVTEWNLNDQTVEALRLTDRDVWSVQYHPEASPGPHDGDDVLSQFVTRVRERMATLAGVTHVR